MDILQVGVQVRCRCPDRNKHMDDCNGRIRCRPKRRCQRLRADYRRHQHQHFKRHGGYRGSADGDGIGAALRPMVPVAVRWHYHVGADHLHFHYHIRKND